MTSESDRVVGLYQRHATEWDNERDRSLFEKAWLDRLLALVPMRASVLDVGCGSGEPIARYFVEKGCDVTGADSSAALIEICRARFPSLQWFVTDMRGLCLERQFDAILAWDSFFHLCPDDQRCMFSVFKRHAGRKAALLFNSGTSRGDSIGVYKGESLYHGTLDSSEYRLLLHQNGFDVVSHVVDDASCGGRTVWLAQLR